MAMAMTGLTGVGGRSATAAIGTTTRSTAGLDRVAACIVVVDLTAEVGPDRLQHHIDVALDPKTGTQSRDVKLARTEVVEHRGAAIEQRLDVDEVPRPIPLLEDLLTKGKATRPRCFRSPGLRQVICVGHAQHARRVGWHQRA
jgi:hypothetical protein